MGGLELALSSARERKWLRFRASPRSVKQNLDPEPYGILATTVCQFAAKLTCNVWPLLKPRRDVDPRNVGLGTDIHLTEGSMSRSKLVLGTALSVALAVGPVQAAPSFPSAPQVKGVTQIQWHHRGGWGWGPWAWLGLGAGVVAGAIIADEAYRPHPGHYYDEGAYDGPYYYPANYRGDPREICQQNFRTFEWRTGLYTAPSGEKRLCPYLRDAGPPPDGPPPPPRAPY